jgi:hypothetical protein
MKITEMIIMLSEQLKHHGDIDVVMQATLLSDGFTSQNMPKFPCVFESSVESYRVLNDGDKKRVRLYWQH